MANLGSETGGAANVTQLSDANPSGTTLGQSSTDLISLYNVTPVAQASNAAAVTTGVAGSVTTATPLSTAPYGYSSAQAAAVLTAINNLNTVANANAVLVAAIRNALVNVGIMTGP